MTNPNEIAGEYELELVERSAIADDGEPELIAAALAYAEIGWAVFPITRAKTPLAGSHGYRDASLNSSTIRALFSSPHAKALAIATGRSRLVVLDIDPRNGGGETATRVLVDEMLPHPVKRTPRGGVHHVFQAPVCSNIRTKAHALGQGIDVEASGAGVMFAPPTPGYSWIVSPFQTPAPHLPYWLWKLLPKVEPPRRTMTPRGKRSIPFSLAETLELAGRLGRVKKSSGGWLVICPAHADRRNSLSILQGSDGQPVFYCFADCPFSEIIAALKRLAGAT